MTNTFNLERIFKNKNLTDTDKRILKIILNNPVNVQNNGIRKLAEQSFSSPASIERLAKKLDYAGYSELLYHAKVITTSAQNVEAKELNGLSILPPHIFRERLLKIFNRTNYIYLYGEGFNEFVTEYIYRKLLVNRFQTLLLSGIEIPLVYEDSQKPVLLLISRSGENFSCLQKIEQINNIQGSLISITANPHSTISQKSDLPIYIPDDQKSDMANILYTTFFGDSINAFEKILSWVNEENNNETDDT